MGALTKYHSAEKYVYLLLLFTAAVIPLNQVFTLLMVAVTFVAGFAVAVKYHKIKRVPVLPLPLQILLYLLFAITWFSLRFSADEAVSSYNFGYVVGQYVLFVWLVLRYGGDGKLDFDWTNQTGRVPYRYWRCCWQLVLPMGFWVCTSILPAWCLPTRGLTRRSFRS